MDELEDLLREVRQRYPVLRERKRGAFYRGGRGWLHFHEDPAGLFADLKMQGTFVRYRVSTRAERTSLLRHMRASLGDDK